MNNLTRFLMLAYFSMFLNACATAPSSSAEKSVSIAASPSKNWYLVKKNPPIYFPKGFQADSPTTIKDGEWVYAGKHGEAWFIPKNGVKGISSKLLMEEAMSRRTQYQNVKLKTETVSQETLLRFQPIYMFFGGNFLRYMSGNMEEGEHFIPLSAM